MHRDVRLSWLTCASSVSMASRFILQRKTLLALEKEEEEERNKTIESLKTALRTQPMRSSMFFIMSRHLYLHMVLSVTLRFKSVGSERMNTFYSARMH